MPTLTAYGTIKDGKLTLASKKRFEEDLRGFKDCPVEITIKKKNRRSHPANRYLWGVVYKEVEIRLKQLGNDVNADVVHEFFKGKFLEQPIVGEGGEVIEMRPGSTAELNSDDFTDYVNKIMKWCAEHIDLYIPGPNEILTMNF